MALQSQTLSLGVVPRRELRDSGVSLPRDFDLKWRGCEPGIVDAVLAFHVAHAERGPMRWPFGADLRTAGSVRIGGRPSRPADPFEAIADGIGMVPENRKEQGLFLDHSVEDNIAISSLDRFVAAGAFGLHPFFAGE
ncbi:hypothetical protein [Mesorhizobium ciceri]|uniref:hypothetical protein n=1 Tax=Mesorhizobium ciceri TaxID=39645 RepID=UPI001F15C875|nr:hypothetical protein [Mesorhizobium ciceri]MCF6125467.1 hypothetical protein [Mesorhizobium ciceri]